MQCELAAAARHALCCAVLCYAVLCCAVLCCVLAPPLLSSPVKSDSKSGLHCSLSPLFCCRYLGLDLLVHCDDATFEELFEASTPLLQLN